MEAQVGVRLFKEAPKHSMKCSVFIGDDDSSTIARIRDEVSYAVGKWSDSSQTTGTLVSHLYKIRSKKENSAGESVLSQKITDYFRKCFSYCLSQKKGEPEKNEKNHSWLLYPRPECQENKLSSCMWLQNPESYSHKDLSNGKDLKGQNLKKNLTNLFQVYSSDIVVNKLVQNASSQSTENLNSTVGFKAPQIRFYGVKVPLNELLRLLPRQTLENSTWQTPYNVLILSLVLLRCMTNSRSYDLQKKTCCSG